MSKTKILMVCLGNICRSTLAQGILESKLLPEHFEVDSAGTGDWHVGDPPDHRSIRIGRDHGIDISKQKGRQIKTADFQNFDHIYVMDSSNYKDVRDLATSQSAKNKVKLILDILDHGHREVPDPYTGTMEDFENVFQLLDKATDRIASQLQDAQKS